MKIYSGAVQAMLTIGVAVLGGANANFQTDEPTASPVAGGNEVERCGDIGHEYVLDFENAQVTTNTLGQGDNGEIRYSNVGTYRDNSGDNSIQLVIKQALGSTYTPKNLDNNGKTEYYGQINVLSNNGQGTFDFCFENPNTGEKVLLDSFFLSFYDIDGASGGGGFETISMQNSAFVEAYLTENTEIERSESTHGLVGFSATTIGTGDDNPLDPLHLTAQQSNRGVSFLIEDTDCVRVKLSVECNDNACNGGRNFLFSGKASTQILPPCPPSSYEGGGAKDQGASGDPHFKTWSGEKYDYHGICDLVLLRNPAFARGLGMEIHIRSKKTKNWSFISTASVRIGSEIFEVSGAKDGDHHYLNGNANIMGFEHVDIKNKGDIGQSTVNGYPMTLKVLNAYQRSYNIELRNAADGGGEIGTVIQIKTWKDFVRVDIMNPTDTLFNGSGGLMGSYPSGDTVGRDGNTIINDIQQFGQEWQVLASEPKIFHLKNDGPQQPESMCVSPSASSMRRGLAESMVSVKDAEVACMQLGGTNNNYREDEFDLCVFDVMATGDMSIASGGAY